MRTVLASVVIALGVAETVAALRAGDWPGIVVGAAVALAVGALAIAAKRRRRTVAAPRSHYRDALARAHLRSAQLAAARHAIASRDPVPVRIIEVFVEHADAFEHPLARLFIAQWDQLVETERALRSAGEDDEEVVQSLQLVQQTGVFADTVAREWSAHADRFAAAPSAAVPRFAPLGDAIAHLARAGGVPATFSSASADLVAACASPTAAERVAAAHRLIEAAPALPGELAWLRRIGETVVLDERPGRSPLRQ